MSARELAELAARDIANAIREVNAGAGRLMVRWPITLTVVTEDGEYGFFFEDLVTTYRNEQPI